MIRRRSAETIVLSWMLAVAAPIAGVAAERDHHIAVDDYFTLAPAAWTGGDHSPEKRAEPGVLLHLSVTATGGATAFFGARFAAAARTIFA